MGNTRNPWWLICSWYHDNTLFGLDPLTQQQGESLNKHLQAAGYNAILKMANFNQSAKQYINPTYLPQLIKAAPDGRMSWAPNFQGFPQPDSAKHEFSALYLQQVAKEFDSEQAAQTSKEGDSADVLATQSSNIADGLATRNIRGDNLADDLHNINGEQDEGSEDGGVDDAFKTSPSRARQPSIPGGFDNGSMHEVDIHPSSTLSPTRAQGPAAPKHLVHPTDPSHTTSDYNTDIPKAKADLAKERSSLILYRARLDKEWQTLQASQASLAKEQEALVTAVASLQRLQTFFETGWTKVQNFATELNEWHESLKKKQERMGAFREQVNECRVWVLRAFRKRGSDEDMRDSGVVRRLEEVLGVAWEV